MKKNTKIIALFLSIVFTFASTVNATNNTYIYQENNIEITIKHSGLSEEKLLHIAHLLISEETTNDVQTYGLMCTLFGHKLITTQDEVVRHMVYDTYPHCESKYYRTTTCERNNCNYAEVELLSVESIGCCVP